jgi:hypothetical protein
MQDLISDNKHLFPKGGVSFGDFGCLILQKSLKELCVKTAATNVRFWGKIRGTEQDYYIAEVTADAANQEAAEEEGEEGNTNEKAGEGVNALTYFVTNDPSSCKWT